MLQQLSIKQKSLALGVLVVTICLATVAILVPTQQRVGDTFEQYLDTVAERRGLLLEMRAGFGYGGGIHQFKNYVLRGKDKHREGFLAAHKRVSVAAEAYANLPDLNDQEQESLKNILHVFDRYESFLPLVKTEWAMGSTSGQIDSLVKVNDSPALEGFSYIDQRTSELTAKYHESLIAVVETAEQQTFQTMGVAVVLIAGLLALITHSIVTPLSHAVAAVSDIAAGEGDLRRRLKVNGRDEVAQLGEGFNQLMEKIQTLVLQVRESSEQVASAASTTSDAILRSNEGAQRQVAETEGVAVTMEEVDAAVKEIGVNADQASHNAEHALSSTNDGRKVVLGMIESIGHLTQDVESASSVISELEQDSENIGAVLDVIGGIAEQTNLLALNAAIEAARAGEQGRGFAVVAEEVRTLASRTQESTQEIQAMIERLQSGSKRAVQVMQTSSQRAAESAAEGERARDSLAAITDAVSGITEASSRIAGAIDQQNSMTSAVKNSLFNISAVIEENARNTADTAGASTELAALADGLKHRIVQFKA